MSGRRVAMAFFWVTLQGLLIGLTVGAWSMGHNINPLIFVAQVALAVLVLWTNYMSLRKAS